MGSFVQLRVDCHCTNSLSFSSNTQGEQTEQTKGLLNYPPSGGGPPGANTGRGRGDQPRALSLDTKFEVYPPVGLTSLSTGETVMCICLAVMMVSSTCWMSLRSTRTNNQVRH